MARHLFKPYPGSGLIRSISLCGCCQSTREAQAATEGQHARAGDCRECERERLKDEEQRR
jgi:hypothetical protein